MDGIPTETVSTSISLTQMPSLNEASLPTEMSGLFNLFEQGASATLPMVVLGNRLGSWHAVLQTALEAQGQTLLTLPSLEALTEWSQQQMAEAVLLGSSHLDFLIANPAYSSQLKRWCQESHCSLILVEMATFDVTKGLPDRLYAAGVDDFILLPDNYDYQHVILTRLQWNIRQKQALYQSEQLASQMTDLNNELYERNRQVEKELYVARQLQQSLLPTFIADPVLAAAQAEGQNDLSAPPQFTKTHYLDHRMRITGMYLPCDSLGGDLYDIVPFNDGTIGISVADVSGHGVPAAFITAIYKSSFYRIALTYDRPDQMLYHLNNELASIIKTGDYVTSFYGRLTDGGTRLEYSGAGHPYPILYRPRSGALERLAENGTPLVWIPDMDYPMGELYLEPGDKVLIFTDGISEIKNPLGQIYDEPALEQLFKRVVDSGEPRILDALIQQLSDYTQGYPLQDDMSMVLIEVFEDAAVGA
ncbi:MAG: PP2C family protein-serine/threonine phosphatase [Candidatus Melainabacteria bacterium]|nr:PP2C family protein-serine/threonine phosphatase [Candidatus Melainabacteria bacterium]